METSKLDEFVNSLKISDKRKKLIKKIFSDQATYLSNENITDESVEDLSKIDLNVMFGVYIGVTSGFKSIKNGVEEMFNANKKKEGSN